MTHSDQLGRIRSALMNVKEGSGKTTVAFDVGGKYRKSVKVSDSRVNVSYPIPDHPRDTIRHLSPYSKMLCIEEWQPNDFADLSFEVWDIDALTHWIDQYFIRVLECDATTYDLIVHATYDDANTSTSIESMGTTYFYLGESSIGANGVISMRASGWDLNNTWTGYITIDLKDPNYGLWLWVRSQEKYRSENITITHRYIETLRQEFLAAQAEQK